MKTLYTLLALVCTVAFTHAQITLIPDQGFEQFLIDQNIDSDATLNGQVLTSDIDSITELTFNFPLWNATGLQDFTALEYLLIPYNYIGSGVNGGVDLDLSSNTNLQSLYMYGEDDALTNYITRIVLNNNLTLQNIDVYGNYTLRQLDLKTGSTDVSNLNINISVGLPRPASEVNYSNNDQLFCIKVTDEAAATAGTGVYATWTISANNNPYYFSETCSLSTQQFNANSIALYPNPATKNLYLQSAIQGITNVNIYNLQGKLVKYFTGKSIDKVSVNDLPTGLYVLEAISKEGSLKKKFMKE